MLDGKDSDGFNWSLYNDAEFRLLTQHTQIGIQA